MNKRNYMSPYGTVIRLETTDLIATSGPNFAFEDGTDHIEIGDEIPF